MSLQTQCVLGTAFRTQSSVLFFHDLLPLFLFDRKAVTAGVSRRLILSLDAVQCMQRRHGYGGDSRSRAGIAKRGKPGASDQRMGLSVEPQAYLLSVQSSHNVYIPSTISSSLSPCPHLKSRRG